MESMSFLESCWSLGSRREATRLFGAACEVGGEEVTEGGTLGLLGSDGGLVDVAAAFFGMLDHVFAFEGGEEGADGGVGRWIGEVFLHFLRGALAETVKNFDDLPLTTRTSVPLSNRFMAAA